MSSPYTSTPVSGYNANPPSDDGTDVSTNLVTWSMVKSKLGDPLNSYAAAENSALITAFGKTLSGASVANTAVNYAAGAADQGRLIRVTAASVTVTTPDATSVSSPFVFAVLAYSAGSTSLGGFGGTQTIDGSVSISIPAGAGVFLFTDGANWFTAGQNWFASPISVPQGRLTLVSGSPVMNSNQTAKTAIFYTPYCGNQCPIPNGTAFKQNSFSELTLTLNNTNYLISTLYDVYIFLDPSDGTTVRIGSSPAWANSSAGTSARGSGAGTAEITRLNGMFTNNNAMTMRNNATTFSVATKSATYVGTTFMTVAGQTSMNYLPTAAAGGNNSVLGLFNAYNRIPTIVVSRDSTSSWTYNSSTARAANANTNNAVNYIDGLAEVPPDVTYMVTATMTSGDCVVGVNINSTSAIPNITSGAGFGATSGYAMPISARGMILPVLGFNTLTAIEKVPSGTTTFYGTGLDSSTGNTQSLTALLSI